MHDEAPLVRQEAETDGELKNFLYSCFDIGEVLHSAVSEGKVFLSARLASASASRDLNFLPCLSQNLDKHQLFSNIIQVYVIPCLRLTLKM
jgi:hypothetical protein